MTTSASIDGVLVTGLRQIIDERGVVLHHMRSDSPEFTTFGECYFSETVPGSVKAWKRHGKQTQHLAVPIGSVRLVVYDNRRTPGNRTRTTRRLQQAPHSQGPLVRIHLHE